ncbi:kallikrein-6-like isoform X2 [Oculina patagonica]
MKRSMPDLPIDDWNTRCYITGWGRLRPGGSSSTVLKQAFVRLVSKKHCKRRYPGQLQDSMLCADFGYWSSEFCQGDSGGPLVCAFGDKWYLEGAFSWRNGCGKFGVYSKLRYFVKWANGNMKRF